MTRAGDAMRAVPRRDFLPPDQQDCAGVDAPIRIGYGATNSQPTTVRAMLDLLQPAPGDRVLDVGAGSGWTTALLAWLVGGTGRVVGVERIPQLVIGARECLGDRFPRAELHVAEAGVLGWPARAPYDRILVSADAADLPKSLVDQLAPGGVMVVPVHGEMLRITCTEDGPEIETHGRYLFVPLVED